jgi:hypothetical protein
MSHRREEQCTYLHRIDFEIIEKQILKKYARSFFGSLLIFFSGSLMLCLRDYYKLKTLPSFLKENFCGFRSFRSFCPWNKVLDWKNQFGKTGDQTNAQQKRGQKRQMIFFNFFSEGSPNRSYKNGTDNVFNKMVQSYRVFMNGRKFYTEIFF